MAESRTFKVGSPLMTGLDISNWQEDIKRGFDEFYIACPIKVDGIYDVKTRAYTASLCHALGMNAGVEMLNGVTPTLRIRVRNRQLTPDERTRMGQLTVYHNELRKSFSEANPITTISSNGVNLIKGFEGFSGAPYDDGTGVWTIGYGHIEGITPNSPHITEQQGAALLMSDLNHKYAPPVAALGLPLNQNQFDALVSFVYNLGPGVLSTSSSVGQKLHAHDFRGAADAMLAYDHAGGQRLAGLTRRRQAERFLFLKV